jgi:hypothetical protein
MRAAIRNEKPYRDSIESQALFVCQAFSGFYWSSLSKARALTIYTDLIASLVLSGRLRQQSERMKIGDHVYVITNRLQTGAGIPGVISAVQDSIVEVVVDFAYGRKTLQVSSSEDLLPSNLYTHSILNLVYQTYEQIGKKNGSILNLTTDEIVAQLIQHGLASQTARRCVDLFEEVDWRSARLPLRQWLENIRDFYHRLHPSAASLLIADCDPLSRNAFMECRARK